MLPHFLSKKKHKPGLQLFVAIRRNVTCHNIIGLRVKDKGVEGPPRVGHRWTVNPSKNGVLRSPTYQVKSCWKILRVYPKKFSRSAFNLDLVVTVSHPAEDS